MSNLARFIMTVICIAFMHWLNLPVPASHRMQHVKRPLVSTHA